MDTRQRLKLRALFQTAEIDCKPNEETAAAGRLLDKLTQLAREAGGEAPLPEPPATRRLQDLQALAGNEQLLAVFERRDALAADFAAWTRARKLAAERLPAFQRLQALARHAAALDAAADVKPQIEAVVAKRSLLDDDNPLPDLAGKLADALRAALAAAEKRHAATYDEERRRLESAESWRKIEQKDRDAILARLRLEKASKGAVGTEREVLESLERISLDGLARARGGPARIVRRRPRRGRQADRAAKPAA